MHYLKQPIIKQVRVNHLNDMMGMMAMLQIFIYIYICVYVCICLLILILHNEAIQNSKCINSYLAHRAARLPVPRCLFCMVLNGVHGLVCRQCDAILLPPCRSIKDNDVHYGNALLECIHLFAELKFGQRSNYRITVAYVRILSTGARRIGEFIFQVARFECVVLPLQGAQGPGVPFVWS